MADQPPKERSTGEPDPDSTLTTEPTPDADSDASPAPTATSEDPTDTSSEFATANPDDAELNQDISEAVYPEVDPVESPDVDPVEENRPYPSANTVKMRSVLVVFSALTTVLLLIICAFLAVNAPPPRPVFSSPTPSFTGDAMPLVQASSYADNPYIGRILPSFTAPNLADPSSNVSFSPRAPTVIIMAPQRCPACAKDITPMIDYVNAHPGADVILLAVYPSMESPGYPPASILSAIPSSPSLRSALDDQYGTLAQALGFASAPTSIFVDAQGKVTGAIAGQNQMQGWQAMYDRITTSAP